MMGCAAIPINFADMRWGFWWKCLQDHERAGLMVFSDVPNGEEWLRAEWMDIPAYLRKRIEEHVKGLAVMCIDTHGAPGVSA